MVACTALNHDAISFDNSLTHLACHCQAGTSPRTTWSMFSKSVGQVVPHGATSSLGLRPRVGYAAFPAPAVTSCAPWLCSALPLSCLFPLPKKLLFYFLFGVVSLLGGPKCGWQCPLNGVPRFGMRLALARPHTVTCPARSCVHTCAPDTSLRSIAIALQD